MICQHFALYTTYVRICILHLCAILYYTSELTARLEEIVPEFEAKNQVIDEKSEVSVVCHIFSLFCVYTDRCCICWIHTYRVSYVYML